MNTDELPEGWASVVLPDAFTLNPSKPRATDHPDDFPVSFVPMPAVDADSGSIRTPSIRPFAQVRKGFTAFRNGDVILAKITPCMENGKAAVAHNLTNGLGFGSTEFHVFRSTGAALPEYLFHFIRQESFRRDAEAEMTGSVGQKRVPAEFLNGVELPLPPLAEQRRIVAAAERILDKVTAARARLDRVPTTLKRFRQAILAAACSGRLTADWRRDAPAIPMNEVSFSPVDAPEIPPTWKWAKLSDIARVKGGVTKGRKLPADGRIELPYLRVANVQDGFLDLQEIKSIPAVEADRAKYALLLGDVLFTEGGNREHLGRGAVWRGEIPDCIHQNHIFRARITTPRITSEFVSLASKSEFSREYFFANASQTVNLASINLKSLSALPIPIPPLAEQQEIVRRVSALFARADAIEAAVMAARKRVDTLTQAVLAKAFRGELVPTEAALARRENRPYEPAADLLARLQSTATAIAKPTRARKTKTPPTS